MRTDRFFHSAYVRALCCDNCDWFEGPRPPLAPPPRECCPNCGSTIAPRVGRYYIHETIPPAWAFWRMARRRFVRFDRLRDRSRVNPSKRLIRDLIADGKIS